MKKWTRRDFLKQSTWAATALATGVTINPVFAARTKKTVARGKKVIVIGFDGMDPMLAGRMMAVNSYAISLTITTGVAPLLFIQLLYQPFFYIGDVAFGFSFGAPRNKGASK